jgi:hypothetical protein
MKLRRAAMIFGFASVALDTPTDLRRGIFVGIVKDIDRGVIPQVGGRSRRPALHAEAHRFLDGDAERPHEPAYLVQVVLVEDLAGIEIELHFLDLEEVSVQIDQRSERDSKQTAAGAAWVKEFVGRCQLRRFAVLGVRDGPFADYAWMTDCQSRAVVSST